MTRNSIFKKIVLLYYELPTLNYGVFNKKFPAVISRILDVLIRFTLNAMPTISLPIIPKRVRYLMLTAGYSLMISNRKLERLSDLKMPSESHTVRRSFEQSRRYFEKGIIPDFQNELALLRTQSNENVNRKLKEMSQWAYWTLNHEDFESYNESVKSFLRDFPDTGSEKKVRYLPFHISNMGHLTMLFLYINYYRIHDPNRVIVLPKSKPANKFYLELILRSSPLEILFESEDIFKNIAPTMIDTLLYSRNVDGTYRNEADSSFCGNQEYPEFQISDDFKLTLTEDENVHGKEVLEEFLGKDFDWFITLHVRQPRNGELKYGQVRDSDITNLAGIAEKVHNSGGVVIRMGDSTFPKIDKDFYAFDYAHSKAKSEFMDVWLWANAKLWIGNVNGATLAPIAFKKPRMIIDQWYWCSTHTNIDFVVPKRLFVENELISPHNNPKFKFSRCMDRAHFNMQKAKVEELTSQELLNAFNSRFKP